MSNFSIFRMPLMSVEVKSPEWSSTRNTQRQKLFVAIHRPNMPIYGHWGSLLSIFVSSISLFYYSREVDSHRRTLSPREMAKSLYMTAVHAEIPSWSDRLAGSFESGFMFQLNLVSPSVVDFASRCLRIQYRTRPTTKRSEIIPDILS